MGKFRLRWSGKNEPEAFPTCEILQGPVPSAVLENFLLLLLKYIILRWPRSWLWLHFSHSHRVNHKAKCLDHGMLKDSWIGNRTIYFLFLSLPSPETVSFLFFLISPSLCLLICGTRRIGPVTFAHFNLLGSPDFFQPMPVDSNTFMQIMFSHLETMGLIEFCWKNLVLEFSAGQK